MKKNNQHDRLLKKISFFERISLYGDRKAFIEALSGAAPSAHIRAWDPTTKATSPKDEPSINHVGGNIGNDEKATDVKPGVGVDAPSNRITDSKKSKDSSHADAPGTPGASDVRSPTSTSTEVRSPTSTSTEVRSPTSTSTEAYTADNFTATVTGGAGDGANTTVNIYLTPPKTNPNVKDKKV